MSNESVNFRIDVEPADSPGIPVVIGADTALKFYGQYPDDLSIRGRRGTNAVSRDVVHAPPFDRGGIDPVVAMLYDSNGRGCELRAMYLNVRSIGQRELTQYNRSVVDELVLPEVTDMLFAKKIGSITVDISLETIDKWNRIYQAWRTYARTFRDTVSIS